MLASREEIAETLRKSGHRATPQRMVIYEGLWRAGSHPSVSDIHEYVSRIDPSISLATVYKNLQLFVEIGLVQEMGSRDASTRYDPDVNFHINLVCNRCGSVEDFDCISLEEITPNIDQQTGFKVLSHNFEARGVCSRCRNAEL
jgi:Fur family peroxide stress response transcriptional regulator